MENEELISAQEFCKNHDLEVSFIYGLQQFGLLEITTVEETTYFRSNELEKAEKMARLHTDLGINIEGIDAIGHLLERVEQLQQEIQYLRNRLSLYEQGES